MLILRPRIGSDEMPEKCQLKVASGDGNILTAGNVAIENYFAYTPGIRFYEKDICKVLSEFDDYIDNINKNNVLNSSEEFEIIGKPEKNRINNLSDEYFHTMYEDYLPHFNKIDIFLKDPKNKKYLRMYQKTAAQLKFRISVLRQKYTYFEEVLGAILDDIIANQNSEIVDNIDIFILFINFMYWNCDIGRRK